MAYLGNTIVNGNLKVLNGAQVNSISGNGSGLTALNASNISSGTLNAARLATSGATAGSYGESADKSPGYAGAFNIPYVTVDTYGRVTAIANKKITLPSADNTDTKNTAGSTNSTSKLFLIGATSQAANPQTYSHSGVYATNGTLTATAFSGPLTGNVTGNCSGTAANVTGIVAIANGGTGKNNGKDAANVLLNSLDTGSSTPSDNDYYISQYVNGGTTTTTYHRRPMSALYAYIKGKADSVYAPKTHGHNYAGSSSDGGAATSAAKLNTNAGSATQPVYFSNGVPVATTYALNATVPSGAKFTDTTYSAATQSAAGLMSAADKKKLDGIATGANNYTYTLPTATSSVLGGVKTGSNITNSSGTISLTKANVTAALGYTPPTTDTKYTHPSAGANTGSFGPSANASPAHGGTFSVPYVTVNADGHVTAASTKTITLPAAPTSVTSATKLSTARAIDGVNFDGTAAITHFGTCSTAAGTAAKTVACTSFTLVTGSRIVVKFTVTNTAASPTLNVNSTGAKAIQYRGSAISAGYLAANRTYEFIYDGTNYQLVGDLDTNSDTKNTAGSTNTESKIFLIGATSQAASPQTYSNSACYVTNGAFYSTTISTGGNITMGGTSGTSYIQLPSGIKLY